VAGFEHHVLIPPYSVHLTRQEQNISLGLGHPCPRSSSHAILQRAENEDLGPSRRPAETGRLWPIGAEEQGLEGGLKYGSSTS